MKKIGSCPLCGDIVEVFMEEMLIKKRFKNDIIYYREVRICPRCKWYRYSAR